MICRINECLAKPVNLCGSKMYVFITIRHMNQREPKFHHPVHHPRKRYHSGDWMWLGKQMLVLLLLSGQLKSFLKRKFKSIATQWQRWQKEWKDTDINTLTMMCAIMSAAEDSGMFKQLL